MERIILLAIIIFVISPHVTNAQEYIPGYSFNQVDAILKDNAGIEFDGKDVGENNTVYYYKDSGQTLTYYYINVYAKENGKIVRIEADVNNADDNEKLSKDFLQMVGSLLSGGASKKFEDELAPWILQHYQEGAETTFRGVKVDLMSHSPSFKQLWLTPSE